MIYVTFAILVVLTGTILQLMHSIRAMSAAHAIERQRLLNLLLAGADPAKFVQLQRASAVPAAEPASPGQAQPSAAQRLPTLPEGL
jgi:hypothetical protein